MALHVVSDDDGWQTEPTLRFILDTNIVSPTLRWMTMDEHLPTGEELEGLVKVHRTLAGRKIENRKNRTSWVTDIDYRIAILEGARDNGVVQGTRFAEFVAATDILNEWVRDGRSLAAAISKKAPSLVIEQNLVDGAEGQREFEDHARVSLALLGLQALAERRDAGEFRSPKAGLQALRSWEIEMREHGALSPMLLLIGVQVSVGRKSDPAAAVCKFPTYRDAKSARKTLWNTAWDLEIFRRFQASQVGGYPYNDKPMRTVLLTRDAELAKAVERLGATAAVDHRLSGQRMTGSYLNIEEALPKQIRNDATLVREFERWLLEAQASQRARMADWKPPRPDQETNTLVEAILLERFGRLQPEDQTPSASFEG